MQLDLWFFLVASVGVLIAAVSKAGFGAGVGFVATPLIALVVDPTFAVGLMLPLLMIMDVATLGPYWKKWSARDARLLCIGAVPGIVVAALIHHLTDPDIFRFLLGALSVGFVAFQIARARGWITRQAKPYPAGAGVVAGSVAGFTSFVSHAGGPPVLIYLLSQNLTKVGFQATTVLTFWFINLVKVVPYAMLGFLTTETFWAVLALTPVALIGVWIGLRAHRLMPERFFFGLSYVLLSIAGTKLIYDSLA
jgi:uncharacterized membrane protein YfcA